MQIKLKIVKRIYLLLVFFFRNFSLEIFFKNGKD